MRNDLRRLLLGLINCNIHLLFQLQLLEHETHPSHHHDFGLNPLDPLLFLRSFVNNFILELLIDLLALLDAKALPDWDVLVSVYSNRYSFHALRHLIQ